MPDKSDNPYPKILELKPIPFRKDDANFLAMECPYCGTRSQYSNPTAKIWWHDCPADNGQKVAMLNGYALKGITLYNQKNLPRGRS